MATMKSGVRVIWKGSKDAKTGYLKIAVVKSGKTYIHSLKIKARKKDFNPSTQRLRASVKEAEKINSYIDEKVSNWRYLPYQKGKISTFVTLMDQIIKDTMVNGTREKYQNLRHLFVLFLQDVYKKDDVTFEEFDSDLVAELYKWLRSRKRRLKDGKYKINRINTSNYCIKGYKAMLNKASYKYHYYSYIQDPFARLDLKWSDTNSTYLTSDELKRIINLDIIDSRKFKNNKIKIHLPDVRDAFIFACLAQGLRISDIMTLRFNNFQETLGQSIDTSTKLLIKKEQLKVKKNVFISLNLDISRFLESQVIRVGCDVFPKSPMNDMWLLFLNYKNERKVLKEKYERSYKYYKDEPFKVDGEMDDDALTESILNDVYGKNPKLKDLYNEYNRSLEEVDSQVFFVLVQLIDYLSKDKDNRNRFVFPFLDDELFKEIDDNNDFSLLSVSQYNQLHRKIYMNKLLRKITEQVGIQKHIHFHCARHTYTTLVLTYDEVGMNLHDLQLSLGHQSLLTTEKYIRQFHNNKIKDINDNLTSHIFEIEPLTKGMKDY